MVPHRVVSSSFMRDIARTKGIQVFGRQAMIELSKHPLQRLLQEPQKGVSWADWMFNVLMYWQFIGNAYCVIETEDGIPVSLRLLNSQFVDVEWDGDGNITRYNYKPYGITGLKSYSYDPSDILHLKRTTAASLIYGKGCLESCIDAHGVLIALNAYVRAYLNNNAVPAWLFSIKDVKNSDEFQAQARALSDNLTGYTNAGKTVIHSGNMDAKQLSSTLGDNKMDSLGQAVFRDVCNSMETPESIMNTQSSNRATVVAALYSFKTQTIFPLLNRIYSQFDIQITKRFFGDELCIWYDKAESLEVDPTEQATYLASLTGSKPILTQNEARAVLGYQPSDDPMADKLIMPNGSSAVQGIQAGAGQPTATPTEANI